SEGNHYTCKSCYSENAQGITSETNPYVNSKGKNQNSSENIDGTDVLEQIKKETCDDIVVEPEIHFMIDSMIEQDADHKNGKDEKDKLCGDTQEKQNF
ncbi:hypothetical protein SK128_004298, partial [Halocaridina rubra]